MHGHTQCHPSSSSGLSSINTNYRYRCLQLFLSITNISHPHGLLSCTAIGTCEQDGEHLLLPSTTVVPTPELCNPECNVTSCDITRPTVHRQLQLRSYQLPTSTISPLQCVQNTAVCQLLKKLHWLPVRYRITFKSLL